MKVNWSPLFIGSKKDLIAWLETLVVTLLAILIWFNTDIYRLISAQQSEVITGFFWPVLGPILLALRYGFGKGVISALMLLVFIASDLQLKNQLGLFSVSIAVGTMLITMIVGEFRDHWQASIQKYTLENNYMQQKIESFATNYHLLKVSHDQLEHLIAGQKVSLRTKVNQLQTAVFKAGDNRFENLNQDFLHLIAEIIGIEVAGMYVCVDNQINLDGAIHLGDSHKLDAYDPMLKDMLDCHQVLTPKVLEQGEVHKSRYQLCLPLLDTRGNLQAVVVAEKVKFMQLTQANIALLALVANYAADLLNGELQAPVLEPGQADIFVDYLNRARDNQRIYGADTCVVAFKNIPDVFESVLPKIIDFRRGADVYWQYSNRSNQQGFVVLLPLTSLWGAEKYTARIKEMLLAAIDDEEQAQQALSQVDIIGPLRFEQEQDGINKLIAELGGA